MALLRFRRFRWIIIGDKRGVNVLGVTKRTVKTRRESRHMEV